MKPILPYVFCDLQEDEDTKFSVTPTTQAHNLLPLTFAAFRCCSRYQL
jgi:hypothetical protein